MYNRCTSCIIIGHVTDSIHSSNAHTPDERDPGSGSWNYDTRPLVAKIITSTTMAENSRLISCVASPLVGGVA